MTVPSVAANAYSLLQRIAPKAEQTGILPKKEGGSSFGSLLEGAMQQFVAQGHATDMKARELAAGKGDLVDVVTAVADSEVAVQTLVSVRDKMITAYEDIMKMPI